MQHEYRPRGVCSTRIYFDVTDGLLHNVRFDGGCSGNLKAIGLLAEGKPAEEIASLLDGNTCGFKSTSCADQLSRAIRQALAQERSGKPTA